MTAVVLDGVATATAVKNELAARIAALKASGVVPGLGTLLVGEDPGSLSYVAGKHRDCAEVGIESIRVDLPAAASEDDIMAAIIALNANPAVTGYIIQLPLPAGIDENAGVPGRRHLATRRLRRQEEPRIGLPRPREHRVGRARLDHLAGLHHHHPVGETPHDPSPWAAASSTCS